MLKKWLDLLNLGVSGLAILFVLLGILFWALRPSELPVSEAPPPPVKLPKGGFVQSKEAYEAIGEPLLNLHFSPMSMRLPDLKKYLVYYGKNGRPDAVADKTLLHFAFTGNKSVTPIAPGERLYVSYDRKLSPPQYIFSPRNAPTPLWIEAEAEGSEAIVDVTLEGEDGEEIREPEANSHFPLPEKEFIRTGSSTWEIGKNRVDATLLARQRARWYGVDQFMIRHGGPEYSELADKQRIDFGEGDDSYSVYAGVNDIVVWDGDKWVAVKPGRNSLGKPLMVIKKIDDRLMSLELWDPEGKGKIYLNLLKSTDTAPPVNIIQAFKFVGARTRTQFAFEINKERTLLSPTDWLVFTKQGWIKLVTPQDIDNYVERKISGPLFVFDALERRDDKQYLKGTLFNTSRTDMTSIEIPLQQAQAGKKATSAKAGVSSSAPKVAPMPERPLGLPMNEKHSVEDDDEDFESEPSDDIDDEEENFYDDDDDEDFKDFDDEDLEE